MHKSRFSFAMLAAGLLVACSEGPEHTHCGNAPLHPPPGYELVELSKSVAGYGQIQFVDDQNGFMLGTNSVGGYTKIQKTTDGGATWTELLAGNTYWPTSLAFRNNLEGLLTIHCPHVCAGQAVVVKTVDGGATWTENTYAGLQGIFYNVRFDADGTAYANLNGKSIYVSRDLATTWTLVFASDDMEARSVYFSYEIFGDKIFISGKNATIIKIDKQGNFMKRIETGAHTIRALTVIDEDNLLVGEFGGLRSSSDGRQTWKMLHDQSAVILDWSTNGSGLAILNKHFCYGNLTHLDAFGLTSDGGMTWIEGGLSSNLALDFGGSEKMDDGSYLLTIGSKLFRLRKL